jgi:hypothetical protein
MGLTVAQDLRTSDGGWQLLEHEPAALEPVAVAAIADAQHDVSIRQTSFESLGSGTACREDQPSTSSTLINRSSAVGWGRSLRSSP